MADFGNFDQKNVNELLNTVSKKLGMPPEKLKAELEAGKFDNAIKNMKPDEAQKFKSVMNNPKLLENFMNAPQAKALYNKLTGGK